MKINLRSLLAVAGLGIALNAGAAHAQRAVRGRVVNAGTKRGLAGSLVESNGVRAMTDRDGRFVIGGLSGDTAQLHLRAIGFTTATRSVRLVADTTELGDVPLSEAIVRIEEDLWPSLDPHLERSTGSITTTVSALEPPVPTSRDCCDGPKPLSAASGAVTSLADILGGRVPGATTFRPDGLLGIGGTIRLRGQRSALLSNDPALEIDGARVTLRTFGVPISQGTSLMPEVSFFDLINPEDVESVEVVNSAAGALLDGSGIANGLVRIRTRQPVPGPPKATVYSQQGISWDPIAYPASYFSKAIGSNTACPPLFQTTGRCQFEKLVVENRFTDPETTALKRGYRQQYGGRVTGGSTRFGYFVSGAFENESGLLTTPRIDRAYLDSQFPGGTIPAERLDPNHLRRYSARVNLRSAPTDKLNLSLSTGVIEDRLRVPLLEEGVDPRALMLIGAMFPRDSVAFLGLRIPDLYDRTRDRRQTRRLVSLDANWRLTGSLTAWAVGGYDRDKVEDAADYLIAERGAFVNQSQVGSSQHNVGAGMSFSTTARQLRLTLAGGADHRSRSTSYDGNLRLGSSGATVSGGQEGSWTGGFVRGGAAFGNNGFVDGAVRVERSSFGSARSSALTSGRLTGSWVLAERAAPNRLPWLRVRAAVATVAHGTDADQNPAQLLQGFVSPVGTSTPEIRPERIRELELGADAGLFDGRLRISATGYRQRTTDVLVPEVGSPSTGFVPFVANGGTVTNTGFELSGTAAIIDRHRTRLEIGLTFAGNRNRLSAFDGAPHFGPRSSLIVEGRPLAGVYGARHAAFQDANNDGIITLVEILPSQPFDFQGTTMPTRAAGLDLNLSLAGGVLRLSSHLDYLGGFVSASPVEAFCFFLTCAALNRPSKDNLQKQADQLASLSSLVAPATDASFLRIREVAISWSTTGAVARWTGARTLTATLSGRNLATLTSFKSWDPEVQTFGTEFAAGALTQAPIPRSMLVRIAVDW